jgi:DUF1365 family protein
MAMRAKPPAYLLRGQVMHERLRPLRHRFVYPVFYVSLNLGRMHEASNAWFGVDRRRPMTIRSRDYGPRDGSSLDAWMRRRLASEGLPADGEIWLQTFPRLFGFVFNPVSFWYCRDRDGGLRAVMAEVNNTFGQTHCYWLTSPQGAALEDGDEPACGKAMQVSPFCEVRGSYRFRFRDTARTALTAIDYHDDAEAEPLIRTTIGGRRTPLTAAAALAALCAQPLLTVGIVFRIHWQALQLWRKGVPWFGKSPHPPAGPSSVKETSS